MRVRRRLACFLRKSLQTNCLSSQEREVLLVLEKITKGSLCRVFPLFHIVGGKISGLVSAVPPIVEHRRYRGCFGNEKRKSSRRTSASHTSAPEGVVVQTPGRAFLTANSAPALSSTRPLTDGYTGPKWSMSQFRKRTTDEPGTSASPAATMPSEASS